MNKRPINKVFENKKIEVALESLGNSIVRWTDKGERHVTAIPGLSLFRRAEPTEPISSMYEPSICLVAQGAKRVLLGDDTYVYDIFPRLCRLSKPVGRSLTWGSG